MNFRYYEFFVKVPARYDTECTGFMAASSNAMRCFAVDMHSKSLSHIDWFRDSILTKSV